MKLKTCLILSEDPDHQIEIAEALRQTSEDVIVLISTEPDGVIQVLCQGGVRPDFLLVDLTLSGLDPTTFIDSLDKQGLHQDVRLILYGESDEHPDFVPPPSCFLIAGDISYSGLREALRKLVNTQSCDFSCHLSVNRGDQNVADRREPGKGYWHDFLAE